MAVRALSQKHFPRSRHPNYKNNANIKEQKGRKTPCFPILFVKPVAPAGPPPTRKHKQPSRSAMLLCHLLGQPQAQAPPAFFVGGKKRLEDLAQVCWGSAASVVGNCYTQPAPAGGGAEAERASRLHSVQRIADQVGKNLR